MAEQVRDPVHGARYSFQREGENMTVDTWIEPGGGLPEHYHPIQEEHWSVVEGKIKFGLDGEKRVIGPEDGVMVVKPNAKHSLTSCSARDAHCRCEVMPALGLEQFLTDSSAAAQEGLFIKGGIPKSLRGARWAANFLKQHQEETVITFPPRIVQRAMIAMLAR
ncbi:MAG: cupin domain-containing protein [Solirubrobacterales bacterium]